MSVALLSLLAGALILATSLARLLTRPSVAARTRALVAAMHLTPAPEETLSSGLAAPGSETPSSGLAAPGSETPSSGLAAPGSETPPRSGEARTDPGRIDPDGPRAILFAAQRITLTPTASGLRLSVSLPTAPIPWPAAARALGDGPLLAALLAPDLHVRGHVLALDLPASALGPRALRSGLGRLSQLAEAVSRLPLPEAVARHVLDHAPPETREACFLALCAMAPEDRVTEACALALCDEEEHPRLVAAARAFLARPTHHSHTRA